MTKTRRVLLVVDSGAPLGGAELLTRTLRDALSEAGLQVRIFASSHGRDHPENFADYFCASSTSRLQALTRSFNPSAYFELKKVLQEFQPDVVHIRMFLFQISPSILPLLRDRKCLYHADYLELICPSGLKMLPDHSICTDRPGRACRANGCLTPLTWAPVMAGRRLLEKWSGSFDAIVPASDCVRSALESHGLETVDVVPSCVPQTAQRFAPDADPTVVCAARLVPEKGVDVLIEAAARLTSRVERVRFVIAGDGPERSRLQERAEALELADRVDFLGMVSPSELAERFAHAWVQVVPSRWIEPFGLVAAEAQMRGTAVVASRSGALPEIVIDGETGFLVAPGDAAELSAALERLCTSRELTERLGRAARERALAEYSPEICARRFARIYDSLIDPASDEGEANPEGARA